MTNLACSLARTVADVVTGGATVALPAVSTQTC